MTYFRFSAYGGGVFKRDVPGAEIRLFDKGHFVFATSHAVNAAVVRDFVTRTVLPMQSMAA